MSNPTDEQIRVLARLAVAENLIDKIVAAYPTLRPTRQYAELQYHALSSSEGVDRAEISREIRQYFETYRPQDIKDDVK